MKSVKRAFLLVGIPILCLAVILRVHTGLQAANAVEGGQDALACALLVSREVEHPASRVSLLARLAAMYAEVGEKEKAMTILSEAGPIAGAIRDAGVRSSALLTVANQHQQLGLDREALQLMPRAVRAAERIGYAPSKVDMLADLAYAYRELGRTSVSLRLFSQAFAAAEATRGATERISALAALAPRLAEAGQTKKAQDTLRHAVALARMIQNDHDKAVALSDIVRSHVKLHQGDDALRLALQIPDVVLRSGAFFSIIIKPMSAGQFDEAVRIVETVPDPDSKAWLLTVVARRQAQDKQIEGASKTLLRAIEVARIIPDPNLKALRLPDIAEGYARAGQKDKAVAVSTEATEAAQAAGQEVAGLAWHDIVGAYAFSGEHDRAMRMVEAVENADARKVLLFGMAEKSAEGGYFDEALRTALTTDDVQLTHPAIDKLADLWEEAEEQDGTFRDLGISETLRHSMFKDAALENIAGLCAEAGEYDKALRASGAMTNPRHREPALAFIAERCLQAGLLEKDLGVVKEIHDPYDKARILADIAASYAKSGRKPSAAESRILRDIVRTIR